MQNTTPTRKRTRAGMATMALAVSAAGVLTSVSPASAADPLNPPENVVAQALSPTEVRASWTKPSFGAEPTYYIVSFNGPLGDGPDLDLLDDDYVEVFVPSTARSTTLATALPGTAYRVDVCANTETEERCTVALPNPVVTPLPATPPVIPPATGPFAPFYTVDAFIEQNYLDWLSRPVRFDELTYWRAKLGGGMTRFQFLERLRKEPNVEPVMAPATRLYIAFFLRNPDWKGLQHWRQSLINGAGLRKVADFFASSSEFNRRYGAFDDAEFVTLVYRNVLGRNPDAAGFAFWTRQLQNGRSRGAMMIGFSESSEFKRDTERAVFATQVYSEMLNRVPTLPEYDAITRLPGFWEQTVYTTVETSVEYIGRIDTGL